MDCPMVCADGENNPSCPEAECSLYLPQEDTCFLQQAEACLADSDQLPTAIRAALQRLRDAAHGLPADTGSLESKLSFLVAEVEERRKSQEQLLQTLSRTEASEGALRGEVRTLADRLATLESSMGNLEEKLGGVGRAVGTVQTDQFRVAEQLAGDLARPLGATASRLEEGAAGTRRVLEELSGRSDNLASQSKEMTRELRALSEGQEQGHEEAQRRHDALVQKMEQVLGETGMLSGQVTELVAGLAAQIEGGVQLGQQNHQELHGKVVEVFSEARGFSESVEVLGALQESAQTEAERRREHFAAEHHQRLQELQSVLDARLDSLDNRMQEQMSRMELPLEGTRAALETWQGEAGSVMESLRRRSVEDERSRQRALEEEARELNARGVLLFHQGSLDAAEDVFRRAVEMRPDYAEAHNNLGLVQSRLGQEDAAVESFQKAMSCGQELPAALNNLGFLYHAQMRDAEAVEMFQKALQADPTMAPAFVNLGNAYYRQGNHTQALDSWHRALELDPVNEDAERAIRSFDLQADTARN